MGTYKDSIAEVKTWLSLGGFAELYETFLENGYDDLDCLAEIEDDEIGELVETIPDAESHDALAKHACSLREMGIDAFRSMLQEPAPVAETEAPAAEAEAAAEPAPKKKKKKPRAKVIKKGKLHVLDGQGEWQKKFFVLSKHKLRWAPPKARKMEGSVNLLDPNTQIERFEEDGIHGFILTTVDAEYLLKGSEEDCDAWTDALEEAFSQQTDAEKEAALQAAIAAQEAAELAAAEAAEQAGEAEAHAEEVAAQEAAQAEAEAAAAAEAEAEAQAQAAAAAAEAQPEPEPVEETPEPTPEPAPVKTETPKKTEDASVDLWGSSSPATSRGGAAVASNWSQRGSTVAPKRGADDVQEDAATQDHESGPAYRRLLNTGCEFKVVEGPKLKKRFVWTSTSHDRVVISSSKKDKLEKIYGSIQISNFTELGDCEKGKLVVRGRRPLELQGSSKDIAAWKPALEYLVSHAKFLGDMRKSLYIATPIEHRQAIFKNLKKGKVMKKYKKGTKQTRMIIFSKTMDKVEWRDPKKGKVKGMMFTKDIIDVQQSDKRKNGFVIVSEGRVLDLETDETNDQAQWINAISLIISSRP